jgi:acetoacetate decarboxylase
MTLFGEIWNIKTNGLGDYTELGQIFHISGPLREFYYRRMEYAKAKYLSENTLFLLSKMKISRWRDK